MDTSEGEAQQVHDERERRLSLLEERIAVQQARIAELEAALDTLTTRLRFAINDARHHPLLLVELSGELVADWERQARAVLPINAE